MRALLLLAILVARAHADLPVPLARLASQPVLRHASIAIHAAYMDGTILLSHNADLLMTPASNMKLLTSAAALNRWGTAHRFSTRVAMRDGALAVEGGWDPLLTSAALEEALRQALGGRKPSAMPLVEASYGPGWQIDDLAYYYQPPIGPLAIDRNQVEMFASPTDPPTFWTKPEYPFVRLESRAALGDGELTVSRGVSGDTFVIEGKLPRTTPEGKMVQGLAISSPGRVLEAIMSRVLASRDSPGALDIVEIPSQPMGAIVYRLNRKSDNLVAEMLAQALVGEQAHAVDFRAAAQALTAFAKKAGLDLGGLRVADASGLSRENEVTAGNLVALLRYAAKQSWFPTYLYSLPPGGKTGSMKGVQNLSGYLTAGSGKRIAFSILINHADRAAALAFQKATLAWLTNDKEAMNWSKKGTRRRTSRSTQPTVRSRYPR